MISIKRTESGKIIHEDFRDNVDLVADGWQLHPSADRFYIDLSEGVLTILHGAIPAYLLREIPTNAVLEMRNTYNPTAPDDFGGFVAYITDAEKLELLEYYNEQIGAALSFPYVRLVRKGSAYEGYGSQDGGNWDIRGAITFPGATLWGVELEGTVGDSLRIHHLSVYRDTKIHFKALPTGGRVDIYDIRQGRDLLMESVATHGHDASVNVFNYSMPLSIRVEVYDSSGILVAEADHMDAFGGDVYHCGNFLEVYYKGVPLDTGGNDFGYIDDFYKDFRLELRNMIDVAHTNVNVEIRKYLGEFGWEWVEISKEANGVPLGGFHKLLTFAEIPASGSVYFIVRVTRSAVPVTVSDYLFDFAINVW